MLSDISVNKIVRGESQSDLRLLYAFCLLIQLRFSSD
jgi:hypothetical protein